jgi:hypothetical protein
MIGGGILVRASNSLAKPWALITNLKVRKHAIVGLNHIELSEAPVSGNAMYVCLTSTRSLISV